MVIFEAQQKIDVLKKVRSTEPKAGNGQKSKQDRTRERYRGQREEEGEVGEGKRETGYRLTW